MARNDDRNNMNKPPRKQDPYVTGDRSGNSGDQSGNSGCKDPAAAMVAIATLAIVGMRALIRNRRR